MTQTESEFLKGTVSAAQRTQQKYGVPASITLAQAILESGWGKSALARLAHNYFGIKATSHTAPEDYIEFPTHEFVDGRSIPTMAKFARYATAKESFEAHAELLAHARRYRPAMDFVNRPADFARQLQLCGYSTSPIYAAKLMRLVNQFDLTQFDVPGPDDPAGAEREVA